MVQKLEGEAWLARPNVGTLSTRWIECVCPRDGPPFFSWKSINSRKEGKAKCTVVT